jgi:hypothetical protein
MAKTEAASTRRVQSFIMYFVVKEMNDCGEMNE